MRPAERASDMPEEGGLEQARRRYGGDRRVGVRRRASTSQERVLVLRSLLLAGCLAVVVLSCFTARFEGKLVRGNQSWQLYLGRHAIWSPPERPDYERFRLYFDQSPGFPLEGIGTIKTSFSLADVVLEAVLYLWLVTGLCGLLYLSYRGSRRDKFLHCAGSVATWLTAAFAACIGLWCIAGGWGPPVPMCFALGGLVVGLVRGMASRPPHSESSMAR